MLVHSVLANVLDSRAAAEGGCILILCINITWHKWSAWVHGVRSACDQAGERQGFVLQSDIPGRFAFLPASLCFCFGEDVSSSFDLFLIVFSQLLGLCQVLFLPSWVMLSTWLCCLKCTAQNYLLIKHCAAKIWSPAPLKKKKSSEGLMRTSFMNK